MFDSFKNEWLGRRVADPLLGNVGVPEDQWYQCVSLVKQYINECYGIPNGYYGNAIAWWTATNPSFYAHFDRLETQDVEQGDIVILKTVGHTDYQGEGHIGIATGNVNSAQAEILEQNGQTGGGTGLNGDAIRTRYISKSRIAGVLRPHPVAPAPPAGDPFDIDANFTPHQVQSRGDRPTTKWGLNYDNLPAMQANPVGSLAPNSVVTATTLVHHHTGGSYYKTSPDDPDGYNQADFHDYVPPAPPLGAMPFPGQGNPYQAVVRLNGYQSATQAGNHTGTATPLDPGSYYIFRTYPGNDKLINITHDKTAPGWWINDADNHEPVPEPEPTKPAWTNPYTGPREASKPDPIPVALTPKPEPISQLADADKASFVSFTPDRKPVTFVLEWSYNFTDLNGYSTKTVHRDMYDEVEFSGTFQHDGREWARVYTADTDGNLDMHRWFAIPMLNPQTHTPYITPHDAIYSVQKTPAEQIVLHTATPYTKFIEFGASVDVLYDKAMKTIDGIFKMKHARKKNK